LEQAFKVALRSGPGKTIPLACSLFGIHSNLAR
jgi:Na+/serine symporter